MESKESYSWVNSPEIKASIALNDVTTIANLLGTKLTVLRVRLGLYNSWGCCPVTLNSLLDTDLEVLANLVEQLLAKLEGAPLSVMQP